MMKPMNTSHRLFFHCYYGIQTFAFGLCILAHANFCSHLSSETGCFQSQKVAVVLPLWIVYTFWAWNKRPSAPSPLECESSCTRRDQYYEPGAERSRWETTFRFLPLFLRNIKYSTPLINNLSSIGFPTFSLLLKSIQPRVGTNLSSTTNPFSKILILKNRGWGEGGLV